MIAVKAKKCESGDWFLIPNDIEEDFDELQEKIINEDYEAMDEFEKKFGHCRTGGCLNNVQLYMK